MQHTQSLDPKDRFSFGKNWSRFLTTLNDDRIKEAEKSLQEKPITPTRSGSLNMNRSKRIDVTFLPVKQV